MVHEMNEICTSETDMTSLPASLITTLLILVYSSFTATTSADTTSHRNLSRSDFPSGFIFGAASAAYQYEGAAFEDGKGPSIWDTYTHKYPGKISDRSNGDVANDFYNLYKEDVKSLKYVGVDTFRMSISWPRILPGGKLSAGVNKKGITFYNNVFNELLARGIIPFVTLFHWDVPQALEDEYEGFLSPRIIDDYKDFAELCFKEFGDRVKHWITFNEPFTFASGGYDGDLGNFAPGRCSDRPKCAQGNSATEPYIVSHNLLLSHAQTVKLYKNKYQGDQKGEIGIVLVGAWTLPYSNSRLDAEASQRALDFTYGWFIDPIVYGDYPKRMRSIVGNRLPKFTKEQEALLKGSFDFLGLNYYTSFYASHQLSHNGTISYTSDMMARLSSSNKNGVPIGAATGSSMFYVYPKGFYKLLVYTKEKYNSPPIYITENGISDRKNVSIKHSTKDPQRIDFYIRHLQALRKAMRKGVNIKGFFAWTFQDDFEWGSGYTTLFGFYYVDRNNGLKRIPKESAFWLKNFLTKK